MSREQYPDDLLFDQYLNQQMDADTQSAFEKRLKDDDEFRKSFEAYQQGMKMVRVAGRSQLRSKLIGFEEQFAQQKKPNSIFNWKSGLAFAASIAFIISLFFLFRSAPTNQQQLFAEHYNIYPAPTTSRADNPNTPTWQLATEAYSNANYNKALRLFEQSASEQPAYLIDFYTAHCLINSKPPQYDAALKKLAAVLQSDNDYHQQSQWYQALIYLKLGQDTAATKLLEQLIEQQSYQQEQAKQLLRQLKD